MDDDTLSQCDEPADNLRARGSYKVKGRLPRSTKYYWKNKYDRSIPGKYLFPGTCKILLPLNFFKAFRKLGQSSSRKTMECELPEDADSVQVSAISDSGKNLRMPITVSMNTF